MMRSAALALLIVSVTLAGCVTSTGPSATKRQQLGSPDTARAAEINLEIGIDYLRKNNLNQAKEKIDRAVEQNPRNPQAQVTAGMLYERLGQSDKAESHFAKGLALDPKNPEVQNNYGAFLCQHGKYERGAKLMIDAASNPLYRTPEVAYLNAANCARNGGDIKTAEANLRSALKVRPKFGRRCCRWPICNTKKPIICPLAASSNDTSKLAAPMRRRCGWACASSAAWAMSRPRRIMRNV